MHGLLVALVCLGTAQVALQVLVLLAEMKRLKRANQSSHEAKALPEEIQAADEVAPSIEPEARKCVLRPFLKVRRPPSE